MIGLRSAEHKLLYPSLFLGTFKKADFKSDLLKVILKPPKGSFLVLDRAAIDKKLSLSEFLSKFQCTFLYLPPYSPELNRIEKILGSLKIKLINSLRAKWFNNLWIVYTFDF